MLYENSLTEQANNRRHRRHLAVVAFAIHLTLPTCSHPFHPIRPAWRAGTGDGADKEAAEVQLRYLQTLTEIRVQKNATIVFPLPVDSLSALTEALKRMGK